VVQHYEKELISMAELRNAIVHSSRSKYDDHVIADPYKTTVDLIENLYQKISNPEKVFPQFGFQVLGAGEDDSLYAILFEMKKKSFSQFPVLDTNGRVLELINTNTISRWLSNCLEQDGTLLAENVRIKDLLEEIEFCRDINVFSYPGLVLMQDNTVTHIDIDYNSSRNILSQIL
jgi:predicted transcriptional regulator